jgi:hypothetical protein
MRTLILELTEEQARVLERNAQQRGKSISEVVAEWVSSLSPDAEANEVTRDPLYNIRAHDTAAPADLSRNADHYLYGAKKR